jgi:hypothetical protein
LTAAARQYRATGTVNRARAGMLWRRPPALLALFGGGVLLVEALLTALLLGLDPEDPSPTRMALLLGISGLVALGVPTVLGSAPRLGSLFCLVAAGLAGYATLPFFTARLHALHAQPLWGPASDVTLRQVLTPLIAWLLAAVPLACAAVLAWREAHVPGRG